MNRPNLLVSSDSYKQSHWAQLPPGTTKVFSFFESRGGVYPATTFFGLQYILKKYLVGPVVSLSDIGEAVKVCDAHFGNKDIFNLPMWMRIVERHGGRLPLRISAVPEGLTVPTGNVLMTVENTDPTMPSLTNFLETMLSQIWYPTTVCTQSRAMKADILTALEETGTPADIDFKLHDFGFRGSTSLESSAIGGAAHLVNFKGTDTMSALLMLRDYYGEEMAGKSIPAMEHSTVTSWGKDREADAYRNMLEQFPTGLVAVVSDSYDIFHACKEIWGQTLRTAVCSRTGTTIIRPDSGYPPEVVVKVLSLLGQAFGYRVNAKGYKVLDDHVRVIQGDGIDRAMLQEVLRTIIAHGWSADNLAFGSGGGLLQNVNRDTCKFAFKCSAVEIHHQWRDVIKTPVTDPGKRSKAGRLALTPDFRTVRETEASQNLLEVVFENGRLLRDTTLSVIRDRALVGLLPAVAVSA